MKHRRERAIYASAILFSLALHGGVLEGLGRAARGAKTRPRLVELAVVKTPPPAAPEPEPKPKPPPPKKTVDLTRDELIEPVAPPPNQPAAAPPEKARPVFGVTMSSVVAPGAGSGFSVRVGNTLMKEPEREYTPPEQIAPYAPVPLHHVTRLPRKVAECPKHYPADAKRQGIQGKVKLEIVVAADGSVAEVRVLSGPGYGLDEAAAQSLKSCRFEPAYVGDTPVATRIEYTVTFIIEE